MTRRTLSRAVLCPLGLGLGVALALLSIGCGEKRSTLPEEGERSGAGASYHHTREILRFGPRPPGSEALEQTRNYLERELAKHGWQCGRHTFTKNDPVRGGQITFTNVIARFAETDNEDDLWERPVRGLLAAHIDSKSIEGMEFLGADDAASAVGLILELARQLKSSPALAAQLELVFFDGEEALGPDITPADGLYGSKEYAKRWRTAEQKPEFGIVLDMVGHKYLKIRYPSDTPPHLEAALLSAARAEGEAGRYHKGPLPITDDHVPLNDARIPTIDVIGEFGPGGWWHTEADNLDLISRESLGITLRVVRRMLEDLLGTRP